MKLKNHLSDCKVRSKEHQPIIIFIQDEGTFLSNHNSRKAWTRTSDIFLLPKDCGQRIIVSEFFLFFGRHKLLFLPKDKKKIVIEKAKITITEAVLLFEYEKANKKYWDRSKLQYQVVTKALLIAEANYPSYFLLFLFDNAKDHFVYAKNVLCTMQMNKEVGGKKLWLWNKWFEKDRVRIKLSISFSEANQTLIQRRSQQVLEERNLRLQKRLNLEFFKPKCFNFEVEANCKMSEKRHKYDSCKTHHEHSSICLKTLKCDTCVNHATICRYVTKKYCITCSLKI